MDENANDKIDIDISKERPLHDLLASIFVVALVEELCLMAEPFVCFGAYDIRAEPVIGVTAMDGKESADPIVFATARRARTPDTTQVKVIF